MPTPSETGDDKAAEEKVTEAAATPATPAKPAASGKPLIGRTAAVGIGIGSAALVAALLYASRSKPEKR